MSFALGEIASAIGGTVEGDANTLIAGVAGLDNAEPGDIIFIEDPRHVTTAISCPATAVLASPGIAIEGKPVIRVPHPRLAFARVLALFQHPERITSGIASTARLGARVSLGKGVSIGDFCSIGNDVVLGDNVVLFPLVCVGDNVTIGPGTIIYPQVSIYRDVEIGSHVRIHSGVVIGADGFSYVPQQGGHQKIPHIGRVVIEDDVELGACVCVDRAKTEETRIGKGTKIDNLVQVAHNVRIGEHCLIAGQTGIAGSAMIGDYVLMGGQAGIGPHSRVGSGARIGAQSGVTSTIPPGAEVSGYFAYNHADEMRAVVASRRLPEILRTVRDLQQRVAELEKALSRDKGE